MVAAENPDAVFNQWFIDNHPDHRAIANLTYETWNRMKRRFALYYYKSPTAKIRCSSTRPRIT